MIETHRTFCRFCHALCGIEADVEDNKLIAVRGDRENVISLGYTCVKGRELPDQHRVRRENLSSPSRVSQGVDETQETLLARVAAKLAGLPGPVQLEHEGALDAAQERA